MRDTTKSITTTLTLVGALALSGCAGYGLDHYETASLMPETIPNAGYEHSIAEEVPLSRAFVLFPDVLGQPVGVFETSYSNGIDQKVVYYGEPTTPGENFIEIRGVRGGGKNKAGANALVLHNNNASNLRKDLRAVMPNAKMKLSALVENNAYGTFGYALGTEYDGQNCMFAWQTIQGHVKGFDGLFRWFSSDKRSISIRARICRGMFSQQNLVAMMRGLRIVMDPQDLDKREVVRWHGTGQGLNSFGNPEQLADGYVTEGMALSNVGEVQSFPEAPVVSSAPRASAPPRVTNAAPTTTKRTTTPSPVERKPILPKNKNTPAPDYMERDDMRDAPLTSSRELEVQTIYVDPRQYATVPMPEDVDNGKTSASPVPSPDFGGTNNGLHSRVAPIRPVGNTASRLPEPDFGGGTDDNMDVVSDQNGKRGSSDSFTVVSGRVGLPPEIRNLRTSEWDRTGAGASGGNWGNNNESDTLDGSDTDNKKSWVNDIARNDQTGQPLGRPCGIIRDDRCR